MNLINHLRRSIVFAAAVTSVAVGVAGTSKADLAPRTTSPTAAAAAALAPTPTGTLVAAVTAPSAPRSVTATAGNAKVKLSWLAPSSSGGAAINRYAVQRARAGGPWKTIARPTTRNYTATGLTNGTRYYFRVVAHNAAGWSKPSAALNAVPRTKPTAPRSPTATPGNGTVKLAWLAPSSSGGATINQYRVQRAASAAGPWTTIADPTTRSHTATALTNGTPYYFRVAAHNTAGWGPFSTVANSVPRTVPTAPQSPTATAGLYSAYLTWQKPASTGGAAIDKYIIEHRLYAEPGWKVLGETTASVLSYKAIGLTQIGNSHLFRIRAHNAAGSGAGSTVVDAVPLTEPTAPRNLSATLTNGTVELKWSAPFPDGGTPIEKYVVQQAINEGPFTTIGYSTIGSYTAAVQPGLTYRYQVYARNAAGNSAPSTIASVTVPPTVPSAPTNCNAYQLGGKGSDTLRIEWNPPTSWGGAPILFYTIVVWGDPYQPPVMQTSVWSPNTSYDAAMMVGDGGWVAVFAYNKAGGGPACESVPFYMYP